MCLLLVSAFSQNTFIYKISKPYCVYNFLQTATYQHFTSSTFQNFIDQKTKGNTEFNNLCNEFASIRVDYDYKRDEFPNKRRQNRSTADLVNVALVNSENFDEFGNRIVGMLPTG